MVGLSVVICTRDRGPALEATLERYRALRSDPDWELVLVDDGSRDDTPARIAEAREEWGDRLIEVRTGGLGLGGARNEGWLRARGALILFTDDDCYPAADLLAAIRAAFEDPALGFLGGRLLPYTAADGEVAVVTRERRIDLAGPGFVPAGLLPGANLTVRRDALERVGGFDPEFGAGTRFPAEDVELVARLAAAGYRGAFDPAPVVFHHHGRTTPAARAALRRDYDRGRGAYYAKCLANPALRGSYLRHWLRSAVTGSWPRAARELGGAVAYWSRSR